MNRRDLFKRLGFAAAALAVAPAVTAEAAAPATDEVLMLKSADMPLYQAMSQDDTYGTFVKHTGTAPNASPPPALDTAAMLSAQQARIWASGYPSYVHPWNVDVQEIVRLVTGEASCGQQIRLTALEG